MSNPDRTDVIAGLRALADFLEDRPGVPTPGWVNATVSLYFGAPEDPDTFLAAARAIDGVPKLEDDDVTITRDFGGDVEYRLRVDAKKVLTQRPVERVEFVLPPELTNAGEPTKPAGVL